MEFYVSKSVHEVVEIVKENTYADLNGEELSNLGNGNYYAVLVYEKFFFRSSGRASLVVLVNNIEGRTKVKVIGSGGGNGMIFKFDWGAAGSFEQSIYKLLKDYVVD